MKLTQIVLSDYGLRPALVDLGDQTSDDRYVESGYGAHRYDVTPLWVGSGHSLNYTTMLQCDKPDSANSKRSHP